MALTRTEIARRFRERKQAYWNSLPKIPCACGCETMIPPINKMGKPARYAHGHNPNRYAFEPGHEPWNKGKPYPAASLAHKGKPQPPDAIIKRGITRRAKRGGLWSTKRGWKHTPETIQRMTQVNRAKALYGPDNPFYGHKHTPEARAKMSAKLSGPNNPGWNGGCSSLPYGPEFTRKFKRLIRQRDHYTCQRCGATRAKGKRELEVHHIDHNKMNNDPTNLLTVCGSCNVWLSYHRDEHLVRSEL